MSLPVRGAWIEIMNNTRYITYCQLSLPVRGAWIEMGKALRLKIDLFRRSPCGERGLKYFESFSRISRSCRSPCGERGLK